jgi:hypothetical protein
VKLTPYPDMQHRPRQFHWTIAVSALRCTPRYACSECTTAFRVPECFEHNAGTAFKASSAKDTKAANVKVGSDLKQVVPDSGKVDLGTMSASELDGLTRDALDGPGRVDTMMHLFGLLRCKETWVGNRQTRGISGGERKRLTTVELLTGQQRVLILDEISTGLVRCPCCLRSSL